MLWHVIRNHISGPKKFNMMKTQNHIHKKVPVLLVCFTFLICSAFAVASGTSDKELLFSLEEEPYADDIPFDTEKIFKSIVQQQAMNEVFYLKEEKAVGDIPFDTWDIFLNSRPAYLDMEQEAYTNDIPFNTELTASMCLVNSFELAIAEESNSNDLPFNTECVLIRRAEFYGLDCYKNSNSYFMITRHHDGTIAVVKSDSLFERINECLGDVPEEFLINEYCGMSH